MFRLTDELIFPPAEWASPEGIAAVGGDLRPERLVLAYHSGLFPWPHKGCPLLWFSPDPRCVLFPGRLRVAKSLARILRSGRFRVTHDRDFKAVIRHCRHIPRRHEQGTWITPALQEAYVRLHEAGHAHSVEVWQDDELVGGLYGVAAGRCFCGESMFARVSNASKVALVDLVTRLAACGFTLIDCQIYTEHLASLGAEEIPRAEYLSLLRQGLAGPPSETPWGRPPAP